MTQIAPICTTVGHIDVEDSQPVGEVVLVEDSLKLGVEQDSAFFES